MSLLRPAPALLALLLGMLPAFGGTPTTERGPQRVRPSAAAEDSSPARVIVQYRSGSGLMQALSATGGARVRPQHAGTLGQRLGLPLQDGRVLGERMQALRGQGLNSSALAAKLRLQDDVEWAVVDEKRYISAAPNDPLYAANASISPAVGQWYLRAPDAAVTSATTPVVSSVNAEAAWALTTGSASITVAVLDTGVRYDHPDFVKADGSSKLWPGYDFVSDTVSAGDGSGRDPDATDPGDYSTTNQCGSGSTASSSSWHGTQTAGLVGAATDNSVGMASVGRNTMVLPVRVLGKCGGSDSDIIAALYWAAGIAIPGDTTTPANPHPAQVISMSLGKTGSCPASYNSVLTALAAAKVTVVIAAGNSNGLAVEAPANCSGALAVAGVRHIGSKVGYSSIGPQVAIAAPAGNCVNTSGACLYPILTTTNKGTTTPTTNGYSDSSAPSLGTSFSTPIVAGAVALMLAVDPTLTPAAIKTKLQATARPFPTTGAGNDSTTGLPIAACKAPNATEQLECYCTTSTCGAGMLDAGAAVASVVPLVAPPTTAIAVSNSAPTAGQSITLSASGATANGGRSMAGYQWQITSGGSFAAFSGATNAASATLVTSAAGSVVVSLTVTDSAGASGSASSTVSVQAAPVTPVTPVTPSSSGGTSSGGGGAMSAVWVAWLGVAAWALRRNDRR